MRSLTFPFGKAYAPPSDDQVASAANAVTTDTAVRKQLTDLVYMKEGSRMSLIDEAFPIAIAADAILKQARREKRLRGAIDYSGLTDDERITVDRAEELREEIIQVHIFRSRVHMVLKISTYGTED